MMCPVCSNVELKLAERQGVEIDYCPQCRGIWLDRGELDKLIERSASEAPRRHEERRPHEYYEQKHQKKQDSHYDEDNRIYHGHKKRKSWLGEILDFD